MNMRSSKGFALQPLQPSASPLPPRSGAAGLPKGNSAASFNLNSLPTSQKLDSDRVSRPATPSSLTCAVAVEVGVPRRREHVAETVAAGGHGSDRETARRESRIEAVNRAEPVEEAADGGPEGERDRGKTVRWDVCDARLRKPQHSLR